MRVSAVSPTAVVVILLAAALAGSIWSADGSVAWAEAAQTVSVSPTTAAPGEVVTLSGSGWPSNRPFSAWIYDASAVDGPRAPFGAGMTDAGGRFSYQATVPLTLISPQGARGNLSVVPGAYVVYVHAGLQVSANVPLRVGAPRNSSLLWGEVYVDLDGSGQRGSADAPAYPAMVSAQNAIHASPTLQAMTDGRGRYVLSGIGPGHYSVSSQGQYQSHSFAGDVTAWVPQGEATRADLLLLKRSTIAHPERCFVETGFCVESDAFWDYLSHRGGPSTFGYPVSRTFRLRGYQTQFFQRLVLQEVPGQGVQRLNLLDPGLMPYNQINGAIFPSHDPSVAVAAPTPSTPNYGEAVLHHLRTRVSDEWSGLPVRFLRSYLSAAPTSPGDFPALVALEVWGFPTSRPVRDPHNDRFVYQRFQRGILHYQGVDSRGASSTGGILLADWLKSLITGRGLPADLENQARADGSPYLRQYCPGQTNWLCRPSELPDTDLSFAFERQR